MMLFGAPLAAAACLWLYWYARSGRAGDIDSFRGYPLQPADLKIPLTLGPGCSLPPRRCRATRCWPSSPW